MKIATRTSPLALWQAHLVGSLLNHDYELVPVQTIGDERQDTSLREIAGQGIFVKEIQQALLDGRADVAVHSAKDLPSQSPEGLSIAGVPLRGDPRDAIIGLPLSEIPSGGRVGTSSARRACLLRSIRPDLEVVEVRGNIATRLKLLDRLDGLMMASAALERLEIARRDVAHFEVSQLCPQVAQGIIAAECRADDVETEGRLRAITDEATELALRAERAFLAQLGGGCTLPLGAYADHEDGELRIFGFVGSLDGRQIVRGERRGLDPVELGRALADDLLAIGAGELLAEVQAS
ncbi:MAG: hydroxymethylbilane synthase [Acidimicrobiales bacterium]